jgi:hypothetical protein
MPESKTHELENVGLRCRCHVYAKPGTWILRDLQNFHATDNKFSMRYDLMLEFLRSSYGFSRSVGISLDSCNLILII